jgi:hypothetical protein
MVAPAVAPHGWQSPAEQVSPFVHVLPLVTHLFEAGSQQPPDLQAVPELQQVPPAAPHAAGASVGASGTDVSGTEVSGMPVSGILGESGAASVPVSDASSAGESAVASLPTSGSIVESIDESSPPAESAPLAESAESPEASRVESPPAKTSCEPTPTSDDVASAGLPPSSPEYGCSNAPKSFVHDARNRHETTMETAIRLTCCGPPSCAARATGATGNRER